MTEPDRGAYTPQSEVSLSFDPRAPRERRPAPMTLIASGAVLLVLVAAVFMAYRHGARGRQGAPSPIGTPVVAIRSPPPGGAPAREPDAERDVFAAQNVPGSAAPQPVFAKPPEEPKPRITTSQLEVRPVEPPPVRIEPGESVAERTASTTAPATTTLRASGSTVIHGGEADASARRAVASITPRTTATDRAATATIDAALARSTTRGAAIDTPQPVAATGGSGVQIGAFSSRALADKGYADVGALMTSAMSGHGKAVTAVPKDGKTLYRTVITGFADHAAARAFCATLTGRGYTCIVKG